VLSTGSPLPPESFDYVYGAIKADLQLSSISGGTDIVSCFVLGNPAGPVRRGEIQMRGLGLAVEVWDERGRPVVGEKGELVCTRPFPSMPVGSWNDPDGARYRATLEGPYGLPDPSSGTNLAAETALSGKCRQRMSARGRKP
jgi:acetoacetyl-CoA synthetase